jgi:putative ABC transport system permease protein
MTLSRFFRIWGQRLRSLARRDTLEAELDRELAFHLDQLVQENIAEGMSPEEARYAARRALGNKALLAEECRDQRRTGWLHDLWQDTRFGLRMLRKNPGFTAVVAASLALGIGANSAILGAMNAILLGDLPFPDGERLVRIQTFPRENPAQNNHATVRDFFAWKRGNHVFESIGTSIPTHRDLGGDREGTPLERVTGQELTPEVFPMLGIPPMIGRAFAESDYRGSGRVMVISYRLWQRRFASDPNIAGAEVRLDGIPFTIVGVMPANFLRFAEDGIDYWAPLRLNEARVRNTARFYQTIARLKRGVTIAQARANLEGVAARLAAEYPEQHRGWGVRVQSLHSALFGWTRTPLFTLEATVAMVLLIACANVAGLLLARATTRRPEIAMRVALGASPGRILRQLLTESVLLSVAGGVLGVLVAWAGLRGLLAMTPPPGAPRLENIGLSFPLPGLTAAISVVTGLIFGAIPALASLKLDPGGALQRSAPGRSASVGSSRLRGALVAAQVALALVLLTGSGLFLRSFLQLSGRYVNFVPAGVLSFELRIPVQDYAREIGSYRDSPYFEIDAAARQTLERVYESLRGSAGAVSMAGISRPPVNSLVLNTAGVIVDGRPAQGTAVYFLVTPGFFATMKAPLRGRDFDATDTGSAPWTAIVNESAARWLWPGEDPIGKRLTLDTAPEEQPRTVIGVAADIPARLREGPRPIIYASYLQQPSRHLNAGMFGQMTFLLRAAGDPMGLVPAVRQAVAEVEPRRPLSSVATLEGYIFGGRTQDSLRYASVLGVFALVATLLAAIGVYGVISHSVAQRTQEIGIRMALGAGARDVVAAMGRRALLVIAAGLAAGLAGSLALTRLIASQLWGITPTDPATYAGVSVLLVSVALIACFVPARRAMAVDPAATLRCE